MPELLVKLLRHITLACYIFVMLRGRFCPRFTQIPSIGTNARSWQPSADQATITGSHAALGETMRQSKMGPLNHALTFMLDWRARIDETALARGRFFLITAVSPSGRLTDYDNTCPQNRSG
ncbi:MAG: hypothetical protein ABI547_06165 [Betaproteobacteria bacterium]